MDTKAKTRRPKARGLRISVAVTAYNEERNVGHLLDSILTQKTDLGRIVEVVVVASGCTDRTHEIVLAKAAQDPRVRLVVQHARLGKAAAINAFLRERDPAADVVLLSSSDVILQPGFLHLTLAEMQRSPLVGMCGGRIVPTNPPTDMMGRIVRYLWDMHHEVALRAPKMGEAVAMRASLMVPIPEVSAVDEASLEAMVKHSGYWLKYVPDAVVVNHGPENLREYIKQRRRIAAGHFWLRAHSGHSVSTLAVGPLIAIALRKLKFTDTKSDLSALVAIGIEALARGVGYLDYVRGYSHAIWEISPSTRQVYPADGAGGETGRAPAPANGKGAHAAT